MSTGARKARKRAGIPFTKPVKKPTRVYSQVRGLGLVSMAEIVAGMVIGVTSDVRRVWREDAARRRVLRPADG